MTQSNDHINLMTTTLGWEDGIQSKADI